MDSLIDFNSPKLRREHVPLIPGSFLGSMLPSFSGAGEENNPFDMVDCQVAANAAAENDPFERVLHDAINCHEAEKITSNAENISPLGLSKLGKERGRKSISLPDLRPVVSEENTGEQETDHIGNECVKADHLTQEIIHSPHIVSRKDHLKEGSVETNSAVEWNYLDDITPPDYLLNSTVDMSCFLDDTLSTNNASKHITKNGVASVTAENPQHISTRSQESQQPPKPVIKSEKEIILLAQKKIENIISKATLAVQNDIQDSIIQRRLSSHTLTPYQEAWALCTPKRSKEIRPRRSVEPALTVDEWSRKEMLKLDMALPEPVSKSPAGQGKGKGEPSLSVEEWSRNEMMKLNIALPEPVKKSSVGQAWESDIDKICNSLRHNNEANISSEEMPDLSFSSPLKQATPPKQKEGKKLSSDSEPQRKSADLPPSPALLPLPLCEDAVRNLNLCSKYSPTRASTGQNNASSGGTQPVSASSQLEQNGKQTKLVLRKPTVPSSSKMAPMKATAPVQNMTRAKSSLTTSNKPDLNNAVISAARKTVSKMPQSPRSSMSGSLPNLSSQGSRTPSRLPSPRRSLASVERPVNIPSKRQSENRKEKSGPQISTSTSTLHSSPRPIRKGPIYNRPGRVLADVNTSSSGRTTAKYKINQPDTPKRGRSVAREKENFV